MLQSEIKGRIDIQKQYTRLTQLDRSKKK